MPSYLAIARYSTLMPKDANHIIQVGVLARTKAAKASGGSPPGSLAYSS
jgi:hypothetical protein